MMLKRPPPDLFDEERDDSEDISFDDWPWDPGEEGRVIDSSPAPEDSASASVSAASGAGEEAPPPPAPPPSDAEVPPPRESQKRLNRPPRRSIPAEVAGWPPPEGTVLLGKYVVEKVLGKGGMGVVVVAHHLHLQQKVAIKFLHPVAMSDPDVLVRFQREARVLTQIQSEHAVRLLDVGTLDKGEPYMVMEYLEGTDLSRAVKVRGPLPVEEAVDYVIQCLEPLAEAHLKSIIHRDLKPSNLYLARRPDGTYTIKLIDFGISKIQSEELSLTKTSVILGSPLYISPEQLRSASDVDARSDIWAIGVILHKLLTGHPPFLAETIAQLCTMIIMNPPPRIGDARPDVPAGLEAVIARCIDKDPAQRFQNVGELAEALGPFCHPEAEAHEAITRIRRLFKNAAPRAVGIGDVPLPIVAPLAQAPASLAPEDGGSALTREGETGDDSPAAPARAPGTRRFLPAIAVGVVMVGLIGTALFVARARSAPPIGVEAPPSTHEGPTPSAARASEPAPPSLAHDVEPVSTPAMTIPAPAVSASGSAAAASTEEVPPSASMAARRSTPPSPPLAPPRRPGVGKPVDNAEFGERK